MGKKKTTTYDVDLLVTDETHSKQQREGKKGHKSEKSKSDRHLSDDLALKESKSRDKEKEKEKDKKKKKKKEKAKKKKSDSSSDSSSGSSSSSDGGSSDSSCSDAEECSRLQTWRYPFYSPSASYRQLDVICGSHQYSICGYSLARSMGGGTRLCSDYFEVAGQMFRVEVYPAGFTADTCKYMSVFLTTPGSINPNHILFEIAILDQSGKDRHIVETRGLHDNASSNKVGSGMYQCGPLVSACRGIVAALPKFIKSKYLQKKAQRYLPRDMLAVRATVQVLRGWSSAPLVHHHMAGYAGGGQMGCQPPSMCANQAVMPGSPISMQPSLQAPCHCGAVPGGHHHPYAASLSRLGQGMAPLMSGGGLPQGMMPSMGMAPMGMAPLSNGMSTATAYLPMGPSSPHSPTSMATLSPPNIDYYTHSVGGGQPLPAMGMGGYMPLDGVMRSPPASAGGGMLMPPLGSPYGSVGGYGTVGGSVYMQPPIASNYY